LAQTAIRIVEIMHVGIDLRAEQWLTTNRINAEAML